MTQRRISTILESSDESYKCTHCRAFESYDLDQVVSHCETCDQMPRPNKYKQRFVCILCDYGGYQRSQIKGHLFTHKGLRPYRCDYCGYASARNSDLLKHVRMKHGAGGAPPDFE
ncbi:hypothetical protein WDU94_005821 [Cyamophila willieti]